MDANNIGNGLGNLKHRPVGLSSSFFDNQHSLDAGCDRVIFRPHLLTIPPNESASCVFIHSYVTSAS
jgi:hypothetical protein